MLSETTTEKTAKRQETYDLLHENNQQLNTIDDTLKKLQEIRLQLKELEEWTKETETELVNIGYETWIKELSKPDTF